MRMRFFSLLLAVAATVLPLAAPAAGTVTNLHVCAGGNDAGPNSLLLAGGTLYGTEEGFSLLGASNGAVFAVGTNGGYTTLHSFSGTDGAYPSGLVINGGTLYGLTAPVGSGNYGSVFSINTNGTGFETIYEFTPTGPALTDYTNGYRPTSPPLIIGGTLYGTTYLGGSNGMGEVFSVGTNGTGFTVLYSFSSNSGYYPSGPLEAAGNLLYGTTAQGGAFGSGAVFSIALDGSAYTALHSFDYGGGNSDVTTGLTLTNGALYGAAYSGGSLGALYSLGTNGSDYTVLHAFLGNDGANPDTRLTLFDGLFYGAAGFGSTAPTESGTLYSIEPSGAGFTTLYVFPPQINETNTYGAEPEAIVPAANGVIYGAAFGGGVNGAGTIFAYMASSSASNASGITTNGRGSVISTIKSTTKPGATVTLTAKPAPGWLFENWTGAVTTNKSVIHVGYSNGLALQANFVTNPFISVAGTYNGLFDPVGFGLFAAAARPGAPGRRDSATSTSLISPANSGMLKNFIVKSNGVFSGALLFGGGSYGFSGVFDPASQTATNLIKVPAAKGGPLTVTVEATALEYSPVTGVIEQGGNWLATLSAFPPLKNGAASLDTWLIPPDTNNNPPASSPDGTSYLTASLTAASAKKSAVASITGQMADGSRFTQSVPVLEDGLMPVYAPLYGGKGLVLGWIYSEFSFTGAYYLGWSAGPHAGSYYTNGFTNIADLSGTYGPPVVSGVWTDSAANYDAFTHLLLPNGTNKVTISAKGKITGTGITGAVNPKNGTWTATYSSGKTKSTASGAIVPGASGSAAGYVLQKPESLPAQLLP